MKTIAQQIYKSFEKIVALHDEPSPVCTACAEEMYTECRRMYSSRDDFREKNRIITLSDSAIEIQVVECAYIFEEDTQENMVKYLSTVFGNSYGKLLFFCSTQPRFLMKTSKEGIYIHRHFTPINRKLYGPTHNVLILKNQEHAIAYDASFKQFKTAVNSTPCYLVINEIYP